MEMLMNNKCIEDFYQTFKILFKIYWTAKKFNLTHLHIFQNLTPLKYYLKTIKNTYSQNVNFF